MINEVRSIVLSVLNKNNYGYISPSDFNLYAKNAQMELYDEYFSSYNKTINMENVRTSGTDYANVIMTISEVLETFMRPDFLVQVSVGTNEYYYPSLTTTGYNAYMIDRIECYNSLLPNTRLGDADKVSFGKLGMLLASNLTKPTEEYPSYTLHNNIITVYPETLNKANSVKCYYFTYPKDPNWTYSELSNGEPTFNPSLDGYQDFEMPKEDIYKLSMKILQYAGISIREVDVVQYAIGQEQQQSVVNQ
jgi:hypothetical protein